MTTLHFTTQFEGWECARTPPGAHMTYMAERAVREIERTLTQGTMPGCTVWGDKQRYELVVTLREVPALQAQSKVPGAGARSGKTRTATQIVFEHGIDDDDQLGRVGLHPGCHEALKGLPKKCECGADSAGGGGHSKWCPMAT